MGGVPNQLASSLQVSDAKVATGQGTAVATPAYINGMIFILDMTVLATDATDTIDVRIQTLLDGTNWLDIVRFPAIDGADSATRHVDMVTPALGEAQFEVASALAVTVQRNLLGSQMRASWIVVDANAASFTFSIQMVGV